MGKNWRILTKRYGVDVRDPSAEDIAASVDELFALNALHDAEHPDIFLRYGIGEGRMYVLSVSITGVGSFEEWADSDFIKLLVKRQITNLTAERSKALLTRLANGETEIA